jgi:hypothetical protein
MKLSDVTPREQAIINVFVDVLLTSVDTYTNEKWLDEQRSSLPVSPVDIQPPAPEPEPDAGVNYERPTETVDTNSQYSWIKTMPKREPRKTAKKTAVKYNKDGSLRRKPGPKKTARKTTRRKK